MAVRVYSSVSGRTSSQNPPGSAAPVTRTADRSRSDVVAVTPVEAGTPNADTRVGIVRCTAFEAVLGLELKPLDLFALCITVRVTGDGI